MNIKAPERGFKKDKHESKYDNVHCCVIGCHGYSLLHLICTKKSVVRDFKGGG